ncbi:DUF2865 domain-containing protein [Roseibium litorale]|uniref:DUF2865 domain-containing protein n=1 Tax=Roseibium litorale TaxID=2803841 RepID=A0ABR9CQ61_9HYPH|nr:DUF2865 domain-containing protein [Roseibium litorale]MBD8892809.1 DUF2865 domain-containing protein [Roseibium litorale]
MSNRHSQPDRRQGMRLVLAMLAVCAGSATAVAAPDCSSLKAELGRLEGSSGSGGKWESARQQQQRALTAAERDAGYFQCGTAAASPKCGPLVKTIGKMQANLRAIDRQIKKSGGGTRNARRIQQIRSALASSSCRSATHEASNPGTGNKGLFALAGSGSSGSTVSVDTQNSYRTLPNGLVVNVPHAGLAAKNSSKDLQLTAADPRTSISRKSSSATYDGQSGNMSRRVAIPSGGTFRTLCVRTCDGFFFPVSFSTGKGQFSDDAARCGEICPAAETELFVHRNPGGLQEEMISLAGVPYTDLTNAYRYRTQIVEGCSCRGPARAGADSSPLKTIAGQATADAGSLSVSALRLDPASPNRIAPEPSTPITPDQVPSGADPDTRMNLALGFSPVSIQITPATRAQAATADTGALPVLGRKAKAEPAAEPISEEAAQAAPQAGESTTAAPAPQAPAAVRVVGPEYFVAQ